MGAALPFVRLSESSHVGASVDDGAHESAQLVIAALGTACSVWRLMSRAAVPCARAESAKRRVIASDTLGVSAMTSFAAGERSAVSIAHSVSFSVGGSMKRQLERLSAESTKGAGQQRRPIHTMRGCVSLKLELCHLPCSAQRSRWEARALRASSAGSSRARVTRPSRSFTLSSCTAPHARPPWGRDSSISGAPNGIESRLAVGSFHRGVSADGTPCQRTPFDRSDSSDGVLVSERAVSERAVSETAVRCGAIRLGIFKVMPDRASSVFLY